MAHSVQVCNFCSEKDQRIIESVNGYSAKLVTLTIRDVVDQHFWFKSQELDFFAICSTCWDKILDFHLFYCQVEQLYEQQHKIELEADNNRTNKGMQHDLFSISNEDEFGTSSMCIKSEIVLEEYQLQPPEDAEEDEDELKPMHTKGLQGLDEPQQDTDENEDLESKEAEAPEQAKKSIAKRVRDQDILMYCEMKCQICSDQFKEFDVLKEHYKLVHKETGYVTCCNLRFKEGRPLRQHIQIHMDPASFECSQCQKTFSTKRNLHRHVLLVHLPEDHRAQHFKPKMVQCSTCNKCMNKAALRRHMIRHQEETKVFKCDICGMKSSNSHALRRHIEEQHTAKQMHQCTVCEKSFKRPVGLKEHMATHTGKPLYKCFHCSMEFKSSANLSTHRKRRHPVQWSEFQLQKAEEKQNEIIKKDV